MPFSLNGTARTLFLHFSQCIFIVHLFFSITLKKPTYDDIQGEGRTIRITRKSNTNAHVRSITPTENNWKPWTGGIVPYVFHAEFRKCSKHFNPFFPSRFPLKCHHYDTITFYIVLWFVAIWLTSWISNPPAFLLFFLWKRSEWYFNLIETIFFSSDN